MPGLHVGGRRRYASGSAMSRWQFDRDDVPGIPDPHSVSVLLPSKTPPTAICLPYTKSKRGQRLASSSAAHTYNSVLVEILNGIANPNTMMRDISIPTVHYY